MDFGIFFIVFTPLNSFKSVLSWIYYFGIRVLTGEQDMTLISSRAWDRQSLISLSSKRRGLLHGTGLAVPALDGTAGAFWDRLKLELAALPCVTTMTWHAPEKRPVYMHQTNTYNLRQRMEKVRVKWSKMWRQLWGRWIKREKEKKEMREWETTQEKYIIAF